MGVIIPQVLTEDRVSGAQIVDGSLRFDSNKNQFLTRTPDSAGNQKTWTWSGWCKRGILSSGTQRFFSAGYSASNYSHLRIISTDKFRINVEVDNVVESTRAYDDLLRDASGWYHVVFAIDTTQSTVQTRTKTYLNGRLLEDYAGVSLALDDLTIFNTANPHTIGAQSDNVLGGDYFDGSMSQVYFIDGQALGPEYFGYTDPLTNTWRPKKYANTTSNVLPITAAPSLSNGALIIRATDASIAGTIVSGSGNLNYLDSSDGINWTHRSTGASYTFSGAKYLAAGGSGTSNRTFTPSPSESYEYLVWNTNTNFDTGSNTTIDVTGSTFTASSSSIYGNNGFFLPFDVDSSLLPSCFDIWVLRLLLDDDFLIIVVRSE